MDNGVQFKKAVSRVLKTSNPLQTLIAAGTDPGFVEGEVYTFQEPSLKPESESLTDGRLIFFFFQILQNHITMEHTARALHVLWKESVQAGLLKFTLHLASNPLLPSPP